MRTIFARNHIEEKRVNFAIARLYSMNKLNIISLVL